MGTADSSGITLGTIVVYSSSFPPSVLKRAVPVHIDRTPVDFWFDPVCPWAWITSRWMLEVEQVRPVEVRWHVMSLAALNDLPADSWVWGPARVCMAAEERYGAKALLPLYTALGERYHQQKAEKNRATVLDALDAAGLSADLADAMDTDAYDDALRASHELAMEKVGHEVGTPVIAVDGHAFFGPVVSPTPRGEAAARLWDGVRLVAGTPGFFELKRSRTVEPAA
jgi:2-hydroxychromene-2-carboxylate isomerase